MLKMSTFISYWSASMRTKDVEKGYQLPDECGWVVEEIDIKVGISDENVVSDDVENCVEVVWVDKIVDVEISR